MFSMVLPYQPSELKIFLCPLSHTNLPGAVIVSINFFHSDVFSMKKQHINSTETMKKQQRNNEQIKRNNELIWMQETMGSSLSWIG